MLTEGFQRGARHQVAALPVRVDFWPCTERRAQPSPAFGICVIVPSNSAGLREGKPRVWRRRTGSGGILSCAASADCGRRVWRVDTSPADEMWVKAGAVDHAVDLTDASHIRAQVKLRWMVIPKGAVVDQQDHD